MRICLKDLIKRGWVITENGCAAKLNDAKDIQFAFSMRDNGDETVTPLVGYIMAKDGECSIEAIQFCQDAISEVDSLDLDRKAAEA